MTMMIMTMTMMTIITPARCGRLPVAACVAGRPGPPPCTPSTRSGGCPRNCTWRPPRGLRETAQRHKRQLRLSYGKLHNGTIPGSTTKLSNKVIELNLPSPCRWCSGRGSGPLRLPSGSPRAGRRRGPSRPHSGGPVGCGEAGFLRRQGQNILMPKTSPSSQWEGGSTSMRNQPGGVLHSGL
jgi:hypothetical protein